MSNSKCKINPAMTVASLPSPSGRGPRRSSAESGVRGNAFQFGLAFRNVFLCAFSFCLLPFSFASDAPVSFRNCVQPILTKVGCNSGACHGAAAGKNGFKLSLRGYDPQFDYFAITRQSGGRRIVPSDPGRSLFLMKPSGAVPHKGGVRFTVDSKEYRVLSEWLAAGHPAPADDDPRIKGLEILPHDVILKPQGE